MKRVILLISTAILIIGCESSGTYNQYSTSKPYDPVFETVTIDSPNTTVNQVVSTVLGKIKQITAVEGAQIDVLDTICVIEFENDRHEPVEQEVMVTSSGKIHYLVSVGSEVEVGQTLAQLSDYGEYDIFLMKINLDDFAVAAQDTGTAIANSTEISGSEFINIPSPNMNVNSSIENIEEEDLIVSGCFEPPEVQAFNEIPYSSIAKNGNFGARSDLNSRATFDAPTYKVGTSSKLFWVQSTTIAWQQISATLRSQGEKCNVWVSESNFNGSNNTNDGKINQIQADALKEKFDMIYDSETAILGYEYGGGPDGNGGVDGDKRIQILVYDIDYDYDPKDSNKGGTLGYFWSKDAFTQEMLAANKISSRTNLAEIFYIDAHFTESSPEMTYSTLIHEFQHMINYNQKNIKKGKVADSWYNEMLSMLAEDMLSPSIGITSTNIGHPVQARIPLFLKKYAEAGVTKWNTANTLYSYSLNYAFGAYLMRNFGGAELMKLILSNNAVDENSITLALSACSANETSVKTFADAMLSWGNALLFHKPTNASGLFSYNNTVHQQIGDFTYKFEAFNISQISQYQGPGSYGPNEEGIAIQKTISKKIMEPGSIDVQTCDQWKKRSGKTKIKIEVPHNPNVVLQFYTIPVEK